MGYEAEQENREIDIFDMIKKDKMEKKDKSDLAEYKHKKRLQELEDNKPISYETKKKNKSLNNFI
jgi:hypothetical protein